MSSADHRPNGIRLSGTCLLGVGLLLGVMAPALAQAQACDDPAVRKVYRLGGANSFATSASTTEELVQRLEKDRAAYETVLAKHGVGHLIDPIIAAARSGSATERDIQKGETFEWMAYPVPPPVCKVRAERSCDENRVIKVDASGSSKDVEVTVGSKTVIQSGSSDRTWEGADDMPYETVTVTARGRNTSAEGKSQTCEDSVTLDPCQPASCEISIVAEADAKESVQVDVSGHGDVTVEVLNAAGEAVDDPVVAAPFPTEVSFGKPGKYTLRGTATNALGDTATCEAMIDVKPLWTFRGYFARIDPDDDEDFRSSTRPDGVEERSSFAAGNGTGFGIAIERHFGHRLGLEAGLLYGEFDSHFMLDLDEAWGMDDDDIGVLGITFGPNFHLTPNSRADFYIGPFVGLMQLDDSSFTALGESLTTDFDDEFVWGLQAGLDIPFGASPWAFHLGALYMGLEASGNNASVDLDPLIFTAGLAYDF
jgi:outer membrane protein W